MPAKTATIFADLVEEIAKDSFRIVRAIKTSDIQSEQKRMTPAQFITRKSIAAILAGLIGSHPYPSELETREGLEKLVERAVDVTTSTCDMTIETLKMQSYSDLKFESIKDEASKKRRDRERLANNVVITEILEFKSTAVAALEQLYKKIVTYIVIMSNLGSSTDLIVVKETAVALESVFPMAELSTFVKLDESEKLMQLKGLVQLITGIRLFNRTLGKSGNGIPDYPYECKSQANAAIELLSGIKDEAERSIKLFTTAINYAKSLQEKGGSNILHDHMKNIQQALVFNWQVVQFAKFYDVVLNEKLNELRDANKEFESAINQLRITCRAKNAVPVEQIYPQFLGLAPIWSHYEELHTEICSFGTISRSIQYFATNYDTLIHKTHEFVKVVVQSIEDPQLFEVKFDHDDVSDADISDNVVKILEKTKCDELVQILHPIVKEYAEVTSEGRVGLAGFCIPSLLEKGLILPGTLNYGIVHGKEFNFICANPESTGALAANPLQSQKKLRDLIVQQLPGLARLFELDLIYLLFSHSEQSPLYGQVSEDVEMPDVTMVISEGSGITMGTQTDTHIAYDGQPYKYHKYIWNEWDMRRQAIQYANIRNKKTKTVQTIASHFRREVESQCWVHGKQSGTQTRRETGVGQPKTVQYMKGLRGSKAENQLNVVHLVLDI